MNKALQLTAKIRKIKLLVLDVDGVLTDGRIVYDSYGRDLKFFDVQDGLAIQLLNKAGIKTILVSAKGSKTILHRAKDMGVDEFYQDILPKGKVLKGILVKHKLKKEEVCFVGDDLVDLSALKIAGFPVAVANGCQEAKRAALYITKKHGGRGAVREVVELILRTQLKWRQVVKAYG